MTQNTRRSLIYISVFLAGVLVSQIFEFQTLKAFAAEKYNDLQIFTKVLNYVQQYYVEEVDSKKLLQGAIRGMLRELDPHTNYLAAEVFKDFETETSGEFSGLGVEMSVQNGVLTVISPIEDTPAWIAGIKAGDKVIAVDGKSTKGLSLVDASVLMRGKRGTKTVLTVIRGNEDTPRDFSITRAQVKLKSVKSTDLGDGYLYVKITSFIENTYPDLEKILSEQKKPVQGLVIDLRRNPGGLLDQAVKISRMFINEGVIVSTIGRDKNKKETLMAEKTAKYKDFPIVVLMNEYSASASEILAGALQDNKRAVIMGTRSFGKGSVQSVVKLGDGSGLKLTVARYYTPSGRSIQAEGISPDIEIEEVDIESFNKAVVKTKRSREKDIAGHLLGEKEKEEQEKNKSDSKTNLADQWWKDVAQKKDENMSPKELLLSSDYQAYQAFNYLRAWSLMKTRQ